MTARRRRILVLGGVRSARELADELAERGHEVAYALAGATPKPRLPTHAGVRVHIGGFGGARGLADWLREQDAEVLIDATHPFTRRMPAHAATAARLAGVPCLRLLPPPTRRPRGLEIIEVNGIDDAARELPRAARLFAVLGGRGLRKLAGRGDLWLHARLLAPPAFSPPPRWRLTRVATAVLPSSSGVEAWRLQGMKARWLLLRDSGLPGAERLLLAARMLGLRVMLLRRPAVPPGSLPCRGMAEISDWLAGRRPTASLTHQLPFTR